MPGDGYCLDKNYEQLFEKAKNMTDKKKTLGFALKEELWKPIADFGKLIWAIIRQAYCPHKKAPVIIYEVSQHHRQKYDPRNHRIVRKTTWNIIGRYRCPDCKKVVSRKKIIFNQLTRNAAARKLRELDRHGDALTMIP